MLNNAFNPSGPENTWAWLYGICRPTCMLWLNQTFLSRLKSLLQYGKWVYSFILACSQAADTLHSLITKSDEGSGIADTCMWLKIVKLLSQAQSLDQQHTDLVRYYTDFLWSLNCFCIYKKMYYTDSLWLLNCFCIYKKIYSPHINSH